MSTSSPGVPVLLAMALALSSGTGCVVAQACTTEARTSVGVTVVDFDGNPVTDATVQFTVDGGAAQKCEQFDPSRNVYDCGVEEAGHFVITATKGLVSQTAEADVTKDECHVMSVSRTITLPPPPG